MSRGIGQTLITLGAMALLFVVYQLWVTDLLADRQQDQLREQIEQQWAGTAPRASSGGPAAGGRADDPGAADDPTVSRGPEAPSAAPAPLGEAPIDAAIGDPFAVVHIPRLGENWARVVVQGTAQAQLDQGPGHYVESAWPGEPGNFALAGHRVGRGSPFLDLDRLRPDDAIVVETAERWYVYRVLGDAAAGDFGADPSGIPGREIVPPSEIDVIAPTPGRPAAGATDAYLTLTTCHPKYSAQQRLVLHARLDGDPVDKATSPAGPPALGG